jgi:vancomycin resistance protein YoaR
VEADLAATKAQAQSMLAAPATLKYDDRSWTWQGGPVAKVVERTWELKPDAIAAMIRFTEKTGTDNPMPALFLDQEAVEAYGKELAKNVDQPVRDARLEWEDGKITPLVLSQEGRQLQVEQLPERLMNALTSDTRLVELPVVTQKPKVAIEDVPRMGIVEQVIERSTYYGDSIPERQTNVERGAQLLNGVVVAPGETMSFNQTVGDVTFENGFAIGFSASAEGTFPDAGGGICQVSTTLFHAIFWGGYSVEERHYHPYRIRRYEEPLVGVEATVYAPTQDLKFVNDSSSYLLVQARTDGQRLYVAFYGTKPKWTVQVGDPLITNVRPADPRVVVETTNLLAKGREIWVEKAEDGMDVTVRRVVTEPGKPSRSAQFVSKYRPQRNLKVVGTGPS